MNSSISRNDYPTHTGDEQWLFIAPHLPLMAEDAPQRDRDPREDFNALRRFVRSGSPRRHVPYDLPSYQNVD